MAVNDANDVTKALAAFGAPSIRYHSFGQGHVKPSSLVVPRREVLPAGPPGPVIAEPPGPFVTPTAALPASIVEAPAPHAAEPVIPSPVATHNRIESRDTPRPTPSPMPPVPAFRRAIETAIPMARGPAPPVRSLADRPMLAMPVVTPRLVAAPPATEAAAQPKPVAAPPAFVGSASAFRSTPIPLAVPSPGTPVSASPVSATPVSATPVSATPIPPRPVPAAARPVPAAAAKAEPTLADMFAQLAGEGSGHS